MSVTLKRATAAAHARAHELSFFRPLLSGEIDAGPYAALLSRLYGVHAPLEERLAAAATSLKLDEAMAGRWRVPDLERDLLEIGFPPEVIPRLPQIAWPPIDNVGQFYGTLYVREGSTRGGQFMARALDRLLPDERGRRFLMSYQRAPELWKHLVERLDAQDAPELVDAMVEGALQTFVLMEEWLADGEVAA